MEEQYNIEGIDVLYNSLVALAFGIGIQDIRECEGEINCILGRLSRFFSGLDNNSQEQEFLEVISLYSSLVIDKNFSSLIISFPKGLKLLLLTFSL